MEYLETLLSEQADIASLAIDRLAAEDPCIFVPRVVKNSQDPTKPIRMTDYQRIWHEAITVFPRVIIWGFVSSGKSASVAIGRTLWEIGRNPNIRIGLCSASMGRSLKMSQAIGNYIAEDPDFRRVFPNCRMRSKIWSAQNWSVDRTSLATDPTMTAIGLHTNVLGARYDLIILDDVLDYDNTRTEATREHTTNWVLSTLMGRLDVGGRVIMIGNAFHPEDLMHRQENTGLWASFRFPVIKPDGALAWPEIWPRERIENFRKENGEREFARQLMCQPRSDQDSRFRQEWFDRAIERGRQMRPPESFRNVPSNVMVVHSLDLGVKNHAGANLSALTTCAYFDGNIPSEMNGANSMLARVKSGRWTMDETIREVIDAHRRFTGSVVVEDNAAQMFFIETLRRDAPHIPIHTHNTSRNKHDPILGIEGLGIEWARDDVWMIPSLDGVLPEVRALIGEMLFYDPAVHTPDRLSSYWINRFWARNRMKQAQKAIPYSLFSR